MLSWSARRNMPIVAATNAHCEIVHLRAQASSMPSRKVQLPPIRRLVATPTNATLKNTMTKLVRKVHREHADQKQRGLDEMKWLVIRSCRRHGRHDEQRAARGDKGRDQPTSNP